VGKAAEGRGPKSSQNATMLGDSTAKAQSFRKPLVQQLGVPSLRICPAHFAALSLNFTTFCEDFGLRGKGDTACARAKRPQTISKTSLRAKAAVNAPHSRRFARFGSIGPSRSACSAVASAPLSPARDANESVKTLPAQDRRGASPSKALGCGLAALCLCVENLLNRYGPGREYPEEFAH
jgi:hypothetical protein